MVGVRGPGTEKARGIFAKKKQPRLKINRDLAQTLRNQADFRATGSEISPATDFPPTA